jgi:hypothetical protein
MEYANAVRGDEQQVTRPVPAAQQRAALAQLLAALAPPELAIPDTVLALLAPNATAVTPPVELFGSRTQPAFDELGAARTLAQMVVDALLQRDRAARLVQFALRRGDGAGRPLTLGDVIDALVGVTWRAPAAVAARPAALQRVAQRTVAERLILLAADSAAAPEVRAMAELKLTALRTAAAAAARTGRGDDDRAHWLALATDIGRWLEHRELPALTPPLPAPPGDPF